MKKIVVLTGAGISAESGIRTFRDADGLWEGHDVMSVASPQGWRKDMALVLDFYNQRRRQLQSVVPNEAHHALVRLAQKHDVTIITQNVDDLHERAGTTNVIHLHGELLKSRSTLDENLVYDCTTDILIGDTCKIGSQLRPHIVWFGEDVPMITNASHKVSEADIVIVIGTSMQVYPAAGLVAFAPRYSDIYYIDPKPFISYELSMRPNLRVIEKTAVAGVPALVQRLEILI